MNIYYKYYVTLYNDKCYLSLNINISLKYTLFAYLRLNKAS